MASSILHRMTGVGNALGTLLLTWWLLSVAAGPEAYAQFANLAGSIFGRLVLFGFTLSLCYHLLNGIRHVVWDTGRAYDLTTSIAWSWVNVLGTIILAIGIWVAGYAMMGAI